MAVAAGIDHATTGFDIDAARKQSLATFPVSRLAGLIVLIGAINPEPWNAVSRLNRANL